MPVFLSGWNPDDIAGPDFAHGLALGLNAADTGDDVKRLTKRVRMSGGARSRFESHTVGNDARRSLRRNDRVLPNRAGEILNWRTACRPGPCDVNVQRAAPL
jgi:hypothetical protein